MDKNAEPQTWVPLKELRAPFNDAVNYKSRQEKEFFNKIFLRTQDLFDCLKPTVYYVIGEKGSGKTAYATYLENNEIEKHRCKLSTMTETQYKRFIALKKQGKLDYSDYANIWRPMLLAMVAQAVIAKSKGFFASFTGKFADLEQKIAQFNKRALNPEVEVAFEMVSSMADKFALGKDNVAKAEFSDSSTSSDKSQVIKHHLLEIESGLKESLSDLKLSRNHIVFIDGIDYRPEDVPYVDYLACIKGLGEASWQLNSEFFANIRDSIGRIKIVLLVRPDVFHSLNLYNSNSKLRDNSVLLDWSTTEKAHRESKLYEAADRYFGTQQSFKMSALEAADHYLARNSSNEIFRQFLRKSFQKPRDLLTLINLTQAISVKQLGRGQEDFISPDVLRDPKFTKDYADYMLGEVRNYAAFYMTQNDFSKYIKFFQYLDGSSEFDFRKFSSAFARFKNWLNGEQLFAVEYGRDAEALLQLFYDVNLIGYRESVGDSGESHYHFAYRERTLTNVAPQVKQAGQLIINPGVAKALDIGLRAAENKREEVFVKRKTHRRGAPTKALATPTKASRTLPAQQDGPPVVERAVKDRRRTKRRRGRGGGPKGGGP